MPPVNKEIMRKILVVFVAFVGFLTTVKLAYIYYEANFDAYALPSFCSINSFIDCDGVAQTTHSQFFGIPLALWGMFLYVFIIFMVFVDKLKNFKYLKFLEVFKNPMQYISALGFISFFISMILACVSVFEIKKLCILCVATYFMNLLIALVASDINKGFLESFKTSFLDFYEAVKVKKYLISFLSVALVGVIFLAYMDVSCVITPQIKRFREFKKYEKLQSDNPFKASGNVLGDKNAKVVVYIYTDYRCPMCRVYNVIIQRAALELGNIKVIHKNMPLDKECNKVMTQQVHPGACMLARYSVAAEEQNRLWDFNSELFEKQPKSEAEILQLAEKMGFDTNKLKRDANSLITKAKIQKDISEGYAQNVDGTPTIVLNGKLYQGIKPYYELKKFLIEAGAVEK